MCVYRGVFIDSDSEDELKLFFSATVGLGPNSFVPGRRLSGQEIFKGPWFFIVTIDSDLIGGLNIFLRLLSVCTPLVSFPVSGSGLDEGRKGGATAEREALVGELLGDPCRGLRGLRGDPPPPPPGCRWDSAIILRQNFRKKLQPVSHLALSR